jgi:O-antigen ligase
LDSPLIIFAAVGIASLVVGKLMGFYDFFQGFREFKNVLYYLLPLVIVNVIPDKKDLKVLIYGCFFVGIAAASWMIFQAWQNPPTAMDEPMEIFYRYQCNSPGVILSFWTFAGIICLLLVNKVRLSYIFGAAITIFSLILTFSRHWWVSLVFSISLILLFNFRESKARIFGFLSLTVFLFLLVLGGFFLRIEPLTTYLNLITIRAETLTFREKVENWEIRLVENDYAKEKIRSHPLFGIGFQRPYRPQIYGPKDEIDWFVHNGYLYILLKLGIAGFLPFLWFSYIFVKRGIKYRNDVEDKFLKGIVLGSVCAYLGIALANVAAPHLIHNWGVGVVGLAFGMNEVIYKMEGVTVEMQTLK